MNALLTDQDKQQIQAIHKRASGRAILAQVSSLTGMSPAAITGPCRETHFVRARDLVCYIAHREGMSYPQIGRVVNRDHTSVMAAVRRERARRGEVSA